MQILSALGKLFGGACLGLGLSVLAAAAQQGAGEVATYGKFLRFGDAPEVLFLVGSIEEGDFFDLRRGMRDRTTRMLVTHSPGGNVHEALRIATALHDNGIATFIPADAHCSSACAFVFFGGASRAAEGELGVHQFYAASAAGQESVDLNTGLRAAQYTTSEIIGLLNEFGTPPFVYERMFSTEGMHFFTREERARLARESGGLAFSAPRAQATQVFARVRTDLRPPPPAAPAPVAQRPPAPPPPATPAAPIPPTPATLEREAMALIIGLNADWSRPNAVALQRLPQYYGDTVDFYGTVLTGRAVQQEKEAFALRWPVRTYRVDASSVAVACGPDQCAVTSIVEWEAQSPERRARAAGRSTWNLILRHSASGLRIVGEDGKVISRR